MLMMDSAAILLALKCTFALCGAIAVGTAAVRTLLHSFSARALVECVALAALALVILTRGAPHNNPALFALYDAYGPIGILSAVGAMVEVIVGIDIMLRTKSFELSPPCLKRIVAVLAFLAALAAAEPVAELWNAAQWGDAQFYDRIAISIARGSMPWAHSYYMPLFQYGSALLYWAFGHFIFVQQIANVFLALLTVPLLALAAWNFFRNSGAVLLVSLLAATVDPLRHAPHLLQIENWYVPIICFSIWAASRYFRQPSLRNVVLVGVAAALIFETRTQAGFYVGWLSLVPIWLRATSANTRLRHFILIVAIVVGCAVPWTLRNIAVNGRASPIGVQAGEHVLFSNSRANFFGIRRDLVSPDPASQPVSAAERLVQMAADPLYIVRAAWWRGLAFYGLLPPGIWDKSGPRSTSWAEMSAYLMRASPILALLLAGALAVLLHPGRTTFYLLGAISSNVALVFFVGFSEPRLSFPILALHILLAAAAVFPPRAEFFAAADAAPRRAFAIPRLAFVTAVGAIALLVLSHVLIGRSLLYPPQTDSGLLRIAPVEIDAALPDLNALIPEPPWTAVPIQSGTRARFTGVLTNTMEPVKWYAFPLLGFPDYTADPRREAYFRAYMIDKSGKFQWGVSRSIGLTIAGAIADRPLREDEGIEVEGQILDVADRGTFWFRAEKIRHLDAPPGVFEAFPRN